MVVAAAGTLLALVVPARGMPLELQSRGSVDFDPVIFVGGVEKEAAVGDVVLQGEPVQTSSVTRGAGALCKFNQEVEESFQLPDDIGPIAFEIVLTVEEGCNLVVKSFGEIKNPPTKDPAGRAIVDHRGWNFNTVFEYANITVAEERVKLTYTRNGGSVYNGRDRYHLSYTDYVPGWGTNLQAYNWYLTGPGQVWIYSRALYHSPNPPPPSFALSSRFTANPGVVAPTCTVSQGTIPLGWDQKCTGGVYY